MQISARNLGLFILAVAAFAATGCQGGENFDENYKQETATTKEQRDAAMAKKDLTKGPGQIEPGEAIPTGPRPEPNTMKVPGKGG